VDYTWCTSDNNVQCAEYIEANLGATNCSCRITFELSDDFPVFITQVVASSLRATTFHRLNGSSSPVLTAPSLSYGKAKNSTPHRIKTPDRIEIKFGMVDYVGEGTRRAKFYANPSKGRFLANG